MSIKAMNGRVVIKPTPAKKTSMGGIILPESTKDHGKGNVIDVSTSITDLAIGDTVIYGAYAGHIIHVEGENLLILKYEEIMGKLV